jgi:dipeptidyl aminopeptidase/acylaminoacyl peptidase
MSRYEYGGYPWEIPDAIREMSPTTYVAGVRAPTLILHGENDDRCPVGQAETWFAALRAREVPVEFVRYPGASHAFVFLGRPSHRIDYCRRLTEWVTTHVPAAASIVTC